MQQYADYLLRAVEELGYAPNPDAVQAFAGKFVAKWHGDDYAALIRAIHEGSGLDRVCAIIALCKYAGSGVPESVMALLENATPAERWAIALQLAEAGDRRAVPMLSRMLTEFLPPSPEAESTWLYDEWRPWAVRFLGILGDVAAVPPLRTGLAACLEIETHLRAAGNDADAGDWRRLEDEIVYALGRLGAGGALTGIVVDAERLRLWKVHLIMGQLHGRYDVHSIRLWQDHPELQREVDGLLAATFGMGAEARAHAMDKYQLEMASNIQDRYLDEHGL